MSELHALLIGIDDYFPGHLPDGRRYPSLRGATRDVERVEALLRDREGLKPDKTWKLLSRAGEDGEPAEPPERRPTYANIVAALKRLEVEASPGDRVYIHYSGHGARTETEYPGVRGRYDEALVPCDIGDPGSRYLRDVELALLLRLLADRRLFVTAVLDCCHAGGVMRSRPPVGAVPRRVEWVSRRAVPSTVVDPGILDDAWQKVRRDPRVHRGLTLQSWLMAERYVLFAACRPEETAFEYPFDKGEPQGALTYWLLDILTRSAGELRCGEVHRELVARVHGFFAYQTPMLLGDKDRGFLTRMRRATQKAMSRVESPMVLRVGDDGRVLIDVGVAGGAEVGGRALFKGGCAVIDQVGATESWARPRVMKGIEPGARIEILGPRANIRLIPPAPGDSAAKQALDHLSAALRSSRGESLVEICDEGGTADLIVTVGVSGAYEILDPEGAPFPNLSPLQVGAPGVVSKAIERLHHLAKFQKILTTENPNPPEWLDIRLELCEDEPGVEPEPLPPRGLVLRCGEGRIIRIVNRSCHIRLDIAVLDLAPDYSVTQLLPKRGSLSLVPLDPGRGEVVRVRGWLPPGWHEGTDVLKVFATQGAASFRWLELPAIGRPTSPFRAGLTPSQFPAEEWITAQVEIQVRR